MQVLPNGFSSRENEASMNCVHYQLESHYVNRWYCVIMLEYQ